MLTICVVMDQLGTFWTEYFSITQVKHCDACQRTKRRFNRPAPILHPIPVSDTWKKVGIDIIELPLSSHGNQYCVTLITFQSGQKPNHSQPRKPLTLLNFYTAPFSDMVAQLTSFQIRVKNSATKWLTAFKNLLAFGTM